MAKVKHTLLVLFIPQELTPSSVLTAVAPVVLQWKYVKASGLFN
jgi:hypothetical protein